MYVTFQYLTVLCMPVIGHVCDISIPDKLCVHSSYNSARFLQFQPEFVTSIIIDCQRFDYSAVIFRVHLHTSLGILLKYNHQVS